MIIHRMQQESEAWHKEKLGLITGTRFATLMSGKNTSGYKGLLLTVAGEILTQEREEKYADKNMERGIELEPEAADFYSSITGYDLEEVGLCTPAQGLFYSDWIGISPDRLIDDTKGLEIKCPMLKTHISYIRRGVLPNEYKWQVQGSLFVTQFEEWDFMSYYPGAKPFIITVYPDIEMHAELEIRLGESIQEIKQIIDEYNRYDYELKKQTS